MLVVNVKHLDVGLALGVSVTDKDQLHKFSGRHKKSKAYTGRTKILILTMDFLHVHNYKKSVQYSYRIHIHGV